ncbi:YodC family protein [Rhizobium sp. A37_96]
MSFKVGDRVALKSGGPEMTVHTIQGGGHLYCIWFNKTEGGWEVKGYAFNQEALRSAD